MADESGRTGPAAPDPIERGLRELVRDTEPLVILAGPEAARGRGERRRARRRAGAAGLVAALALGAGSWQLLPRLTGTGGRGGGPTAPAATAPAPTADDLVQRLRDQLPPVDMLPLYPKYHWEAVPGEAERKFGAPCPVGALELGQDARVERVYAATQQRVEAYAYLMSFADDARTDAGMSALNSMIKGKCGPAPFVLHVSDGNPTRRYPRPVTDAYGTSADGRTAVLVERQGRYVSVLIVTGSGRAPGDVPVPVPTGLQAACMEQALTRLNTSGAAGTAATPVMPVTPGLSGTAMTHTAQPTQTPPTPPTVGDPVRSAPTGQAGGHAADPAATC